VPLVILTLAGQDAAAARVLNEIDHLLLSVFAADDGQSRKAHFRAYNAQQERNKEGREGTLFARELYIFYMVG
jgi:hypothetical protein